MESDEYLSDTMTQEDELRLLGLHIEEPLEESLVDLFDAGDLEFLQTIEEET